jgi:hypothetical protein
MAQVYSFEHISGYPNINIIVGKSEKGKRVEVYLPHSVIAGIAKYLNEHNSHVGHATWHYQNPEYSFPCESCHK